MVAQESNAIDQNPVINQREKKRRWFFVLKLIAYLLLIFFVTNLSPLIEGIFINLEFTSKILNAVLFYFTGHLIIASSRLIIVDLYLRKRKLQKEERSNFIIGITQMSNVISSILFLIAALSVFDVSLTQLFTSISIVAAALAILSKDYISNMINGLIIMFTNQLSLNDFVKIGIHRGQITEITLMNVHLINEDEELVLIPNNTILNIDVINYSKQSIPKVVYEFDLPMDFVNQIDQIKQYLMTNLLEYESEIMQGSYALKVLSILKDTLRFKFQVVLKRDNDEMEKMIRRSIPNILTAYIANQKHV